MAKELKAGVSETLAAKPDKVAIDVTRVDYIDSSGLGVLVEAVRAIKGYNGEIAIVGANPSIKKMMQMTRLDRSVQLCSTVNDAFRV